MTTERIQLENDEVVLAQVRKHWFVLAMHMMSVIIMSIFPLFAYFVLTSMPLFATLVPQVSFPLLTALYTSWLILMWMTLFSIWTNYYLDVWTVTSKRLIMADQRGLFNRNTGSFRLERLQDINVSVRGLLATMLKYGDLHAETASEDRDFVARGIPDPQSLKSLILNASDKITFPKAPSTIPPTTVAPQQVNDGL